MPEKRSIAVVLLVIGTMAGVVWLYAICLFVLCWRQGQSSEGLEALKQFKDFGVFAAGALTGFLARTSFGNVHDVPVKTEVVNTAAEPVPTVPQTKPDETQKPAIQ